MMTRLRATTVFSNRRLTVTTVESLEFHANAMHCGRWVTGKLETIAVIVRGPEQTSAFDTNGQPIDIDRLDLPDDFELE